MVAARLSLVPGSLAATFTFVDIGAAIKKEDDNVVVTLARCTCKRRPVVHRVPIDIGASVQSGIHAGKIAVSHCLEERCRAMVLHEYR